MSDQNFEKIDLTPSPRLLQMLGEIELSHWQCIAELCDNSFDNFSELEGLDEDFQGKIEIILPTPERATLLIRDNGSGMDFKTLEKALRAGYSSQNNVDSLGLFGMGFNISTARLGTKTIVRTSQVGNSSQLEVIIDFKKLEADRSSSFLAPVTTLPKNSIDEHGTEIEIFLKPEIIVDLTSARFKQHLSENLGRTYSYLIRTEVPGLSGQSSGRGKNFEIRINDLVVSPVLPCIWSDERFVERADRVCAVQYIDIKLPLSYVCLKCGAWTRINPTEIESCPQCESAEMVPRERRIWGWLGIQRYLDDQEFGIDFLRNGRKILVFDKSLFTYENPDTGTTKPEYPIEVPANKGRIVGEIHVDHIRVTYQKNNFFRETRDWKTACEYIRGDSPMSGRNLPNASPLSILYRAFKRNDAGLKYLVAGSGGRSDNNAPRDWGLSFRRGLAEYQTDEKWYEEASRVTNREAGSQSGGKPQGGENPIDLVFGPAPSDGGQSHDSDSQDEGNSPNGKQTIESNQNNSSKEATSSTPALETLDQRFARLKANSVECRNLWINPTLSTLGTFSLRVWINNFDTSAISDIPIETRFVDGRSIEQIVYSRHKLFADYGFEIDTSALQEFVVMMTQTMPGERPSISTVMAELLRQTPELRQNEFTLRERAQSTIRATAERIAQIAGGAPDEIYESLSIENKERTRRRTAQSNQGESWEVLLHRGIFCEYLDGHGIADVISNLPEKCFDMQLLKVSYNGWSTDSNIQRRIVDKWAERFASVQRFLDETECTFDDIKIVTIILRTIDSILIVE